MPDPGPGAADRLDPGNPFARPSPLPFGLPPFTRIRDEHLRPALLAGMAEQRAEVEEIATDPSPATVENTLDALERSGRLLTRVGKVFATLTSSHATAAMIALEAEVAPLLAAHRDALRLDRRLFARYAELEARADELGLDEEQRRLLGRYRTEAVRAGAGLDDDGQDRLRAINAELATLTTAFKNHLLADTVDLAVHVTDPERLAGLDAGGLAAAAQAAADRGLAGHLLTLDLPTSQPTLAVLRDRGLREEVFRTSVSRGARGGEHDTRAVLARIVALRDERARLLGHPDHATYVIADETAGTVGAVDDLFGRLVPDAVADARAEAATLTAAMAADGVEPPLQPWDWAYYAARTRQQRDQVDADALRPYLELGRVWRDGVLFAAERLYGLDFHVRKDLAGYLDDVIVHEVTGEDGRAHGLLLLDPYARDTKRGGAWMSTLVDQSHLLGDAPVVLLNLNVRRPPAGRPTLLTQDEVVTLFHEFGHALHGLLSDVRHPTLSGTHVPRDAVEFPSQVNEMWAFWPEVLDHYARHHETGEPLPEPVARSLAHGRSRDDGYGACEYLAAAVLDLEWHRAAGPGGTAPASVRTPEEVSAFEQEALHRRGLLLDLVPPRYRSSYFAHVFSGQYSAGYYSYLWSEVLDADTVDWFVQQGGLDREAGRTFARELLSRGGSVATTAAFEAVRGRPPSIEPLLARRRGTPGAAGSSEQSGSTQEPDPAPDRASDQQ